MDFWALENLIRILQAMTVSLTIFSSINYLSYSRYLRTQILSIDTLVSNSAQFIGKTVKVIGHAAGSTFKSFTSPTPVLVTIYRKIHYYWAFFRTTKCKLPQIKLQGQTNNVNLLIDQSTQISGTTIYSSSFKPFVGLKQMFSSVLQSILSVINKDLGYISRYRVDEYEEVILEGSKLIVQGIVGSDKNGVFIVPTKVHSGFDLDVKTALERFRRSLRFLSVSIVILGMVMVFYKCRKGEWSIFSTKKNDRPALQAKTGDCIICLARPKNTLINPCHHIAFCSTCPLLDKCPICRTNIDSVSEIAFIN